MRRARKESFSGVLRNFASNRNRLAIRARHHSGVGTSFICSNATRPLGQKDCREFTYLRLFCHLYFFGFATFVLHRDALPFFQVRTALHAIDGGATATDFHFDLLAILCRHRFHAPPPRPGDAVIRTIRRRLSARRNIKLISFPLLGISINIKPCDQSLR